MATKKAVVAADLFHKALTPVLIIEGGNVDEPRDPGGRTSRGITQRVYNAWRGKNNLPARDVYLMDEREMEAIYRFQFWALIKGDELPPGIGYAVFDGAVHSGVKQSVKWLQRAMGFVPEQVDGVMGAITLEAAQAATDHDALITRMIKRREVFLLALKTFKVFGKGWLRRIKSVEATAQAWAMGSVGPKIDYIPLANKKADIEDAKQAPNKGLADAAAGGGVATGGLGEVLRQSQEQLTPFQSLGWVKSFIVYIILIGGVVAVGSFVYRWYANKQKKALEDALDMQPVTK